MIRGWSTLLRRPELPAAPGLPSWAGKWIEFADVGDGIRIRFSTLEQARALIEELRRVADEIESNLPEEPLEEGR